MRYHFSGFLLDGEARSLSREGRPVLVSPKAFDLLATLLHRRPGVVPKEALHDLLWPGTFVSHTSLAQLVTELRKALGDRRREPRFIRTVHGFGYAFCGDAREDPEAPRTRAEQSSWSVRWGGQDLDLQEGDNIIGRAPECDLRISAAKMSRRHACIRVRGDHVTMEDLGSKNGTFRGSTRIHGPVILADGDEVQLGSTLLVIRRGPVGTTAST